MSDTEFASQFNLWAIMSSPLIIGTDLLTLSAASLATLKNAEVIAVDQDPLAVQGQLINGQTTDSAVQIWSKPLAAQNSRAVLATHTSPQSTGVEFPA
jgi:alpha-galactosidase